MRKKVCVFLAFFLSACVTVNIYFPAAAVQRAADKIVEETWGEPGGGGPGKEGPKSQGLSALKAYVSLRIVQQAFAQEADINVSNPAIRALKDSIRHRSDSIKPFMDKGNVGITRDGLLAIRTTEGLNLKKRAEVNQLVDAENRDREVLYSEIAKANNFPAATVGKIKEVFAKSWIDQAKSGWWIQDSQGNWKKK
jgi:uncharacterized protein YdbL (DUF1318 family)